MKYSNKIVSIFIIILLINLLFLPIVKAEMTKPIILVLDPGHGGKMTGTVNNELGIIERDITLKIARYLKQYLERYDDIQVIMTHDGLASDVEMELPARGMVARNKKADMMISLHINDSTQPNQKGAEVYVTANQLLPKYNAESTKFGKIVLEKLSQLGITNRGVKTRLCNDRGLKWEYSDGSIADYYAVIRYPMKGDGEDRGADLAKGEGIPGVLIEHCFMKGSDQQFLDSEQDIQKLAEADGKAIVQYFGLQLKDPNRVKSICIDKTKITIIEGEKDTVTATILPDTAKNKNVIWSSSNEKVATVNQKGEITAVGKGKAEIIVTTQEKGKTAKVLVEVKELQIIFDRKEVNLLIGKSAKIEYRMEPKIKNQKVNWSSSDSKIATVNQEGIVTALAEGEVTITATSVVQQKKAELIVKVHKLPKDQKIEFTTLKERQDKLSKIGEKVTLQELKKRIKMTSGLQLKAMNKQGKILQNENYITTNTKLQMIQVDTNQVLQEYTCLIYADVNGDGRISAMDYALIKNHIMDVQKIELK